MCFHWLPFAASVVLSAVLAAAAQSGAQDQTHRSDLPYDGRFAFVRLRWTSDLGGYRRGGFSSAWNHDWPRAERHLSLILKELTSLNIRIDGSQLLTLDDPELFKYPIAFRWEPGLTKRTSSASTTSSTD